MGKLSGEFREPNRKDKVTRFRFVTYPRLLGLLINTLGGQSVFFSKSVKKSVKRGIRVLRARRSRASHARRACEARDKKPTVRFPYNEFVLTRGFEKCRRAVKNLFATPPSL